MKALFRRLLVLLWLATGTSNATAQILVNGSFEPVLPDHPFIPSFCSICWQQIVEPGSTAIAGWTLTAADASASAVPDVLWTSRGIDWDSGWAVGPKDGGYWVDTSLDIRLEQTVTTIPGALYELSFYSGAPRYIDSTTRVQVSAGTTSGTYDLHHQAWVEEWVPGSMVFTADGSTTAITFVAQAGLDDVRLTLLSLASVPEPAEYVTAFGAWIAAWLVVRRRSQAVRGPARA